MRTTLQQRDAELRALNASLRSDVMERTRDLEKSMEVFSELMGIELFDHLIITDTGFTSLRERGLI